MNLYIKNFKKWIKYTGIAGVICLCIALIVQPLFTFASYEHANEQEGESEATQESQEIEVDISHEEIVSLTEQFMDTIVQDTDNNYQIIHYHTKNELLDEFEKISTREVAEPYVDFYFEEKEDGLYIIPTETPPWFNPNNDYDIIPSNNKVVIIQNNKTDLDGKYTIQYEFTHGADGWKITEIEHS